MSAPRRSILIAETDGFQRAAVSRLLESAGFRVTAASTFDEAQQELLANPPDILITGLKLGAYNGLHLVVRSRIQHPETPAIVVSQVADSVLAAEARRQHAAFLVRPLDTGQLLPAVTNSLKAPAVKEGA